MTGEGNVLPFRPRDFEPLRATVEASGSLKVTVKCGVVHFFKWVPGRCECGQHFWDGAA